MKRKLFSLLVLGFVLLPLLSVQAQTTSGTIAFTAMLGPPFPGDFRFNIIDASSNVLYGPDDQPGLAVDVATGRLHAAVGAGTGGDVPASILQGNNTLFITVEDLTAPGVILATVPINSSGYSHFSQLAGSAASIADDSVGSAQIVDGSVGAADVDSSQVQRRVVGVCAPGQAEKGSSPLLALKGVFDRDRCRQRPASPICRPAILTQSLILRFCKARLTLDGWHSKKLATSDA